LKIEIKNSLKRRVRVASTLQSKSIRERGVSTNIRPSKQKRPYKGKKPCKKKPPTKGENKRRYIRVEFLDVYKLSFTNCKLKKV
jgi:hypothetical protein